MSAATNGLPTKVVPAQLGFFAIYNPSLGTTDETIVNQILYYSSHESRERLHHRTNVEKKSKSREEENEQLRQIGLAQGMVEFGRSFSDGASVNTIETEKSRIILHELEAGWWVLASIDLTILPPVPKIQSSKSQPEDEKIEYSSREVKPAILLLGDILRAHSTFLLHHAASMSALFVRTKRSKFIGLLGRYWNMFLSTWTVLMHGNPATNLYAGIKLAACGELGIGVGEEERGSGEREVLEGLVGRIDGLVDVIVSKFGDAVTDETTTKGKASPVSPWLGSGAEPATTDGVVFEGTGALSRKSIRDVSHWIEDLYKWGPYAYGVLDNPSSNRQPRRSKRDNNSKRAASPSLTPRPPLSTGQNAATLPDGSSRNDSGQSVSSVEGDRLTGHGVPKRPSFRRVPSHNSAKSAKSQGSVQEASKLVQYLKLGYGTHWTLGHNSKTSRKSRSSSATGEAIGKQPATILSPQETPAGESKKDSDEEGHYLVGFLGDLDAPKHSPELVAQNGPSGNVDADDEEENDRVLLRTLTVELERIQDARAEAEISIDLGSSGTERQTSLLAGSERTGKSATSFESQDRNKAKKLRVVVYVKRPFVFVMLFELRTEVLSMPGLYRSLHHQLGPLHKPLLSSTTYKPAKPEISTREDATPIYDLIWDPKTLTVSSSIPNIPDPYHVHYSESSALPWSRVEALNTHMQIILTYTSATSTPFELERTAKTSRGWWIVWTRVPYPDEPPSTLPHLINKRPPGMITVDGADSSSVPPVSNQQSSKGASTAGTSVSGPAHPFLESKQKDPVVMGKEIFLIRRASDHVAAKGVSRFSGSTASSDSWTSSPGKLVQGIGVDTKWYIESLLNLNK